MRDVAPPLAQPLVTAPPPLHRRQYFREFAVRDSAEGAYRSPARFPPGVDSPKFSEALGVRDGDGRSAPEGVLVVPWWFYGG